MQAVIRNIKIRELRLLLGGLSAVLVVGLAAALLIPNVKKLIDARKDVATLQLASREGAELKQLLLDENKKNEELRFQLYGDMADLPEEQVEAYIIGRLQEISWGTTVDLISVEPEQGSRVEIFQEMLFRVELAGHYRDLYRWLWDVRKQLGYVVIKEYSLTRRNDDDKEPVLVANLSLASYRAVK